MDQRVHMCKEIQRVIRNAENEISNLVLKTPTSFARNELTYANIQLRQAIEHIDAAIDEFGGNDRGL